MPRAITALEPLFDSLKKIVTTNDRLVIIYALQNHKLLQLKSCGITPVSCFYGVRVIYSFLSVPCPVNRISKSPLNVLKRRKALLNEPL